MIFHSLVISVSLNSNAKVLHSSSGSEISTYTEKRDFIDLNEAKISSAHSLDQGVASDGNFSSYLIDRS